MHLVRQVVQSHTLTFEASGGRVLTLTAVQIRDAANAGGGSAATRRQRGIDFVKGQMAAALGADMVTLSELVLTYDPTTGAITDAGIQRGT